MNSGKTVATRPAQVSAPTPPTATKAGSESWNPVGLQQQTLVRRTTMQLASRFTSRSPALRAEHPLSDDQIRAVAPSIFADAPHGSRSERYSYIPTATVLDQLRGEGFQPFMVCQTRVRHDDRRDHTKHMIRLRHASQMQGR